MVKDRVALALALSLAASSAHAQAIGGGGGGQFLQGLVNYIQNNVLLALATLAIIGLGVALAFVAHMQWGRVIQICAGLWIAFNAAQIAGFIPH